MKKLVIILLLSLVWVQAFATQRNTYERRLPVNTRKLFLIRNSVNGLYGYVDRIGRVVIKPHFYKAGSFDEYLAPVRIERNGKYGYINKSGQLVIKPQFQHARPFSEGLAAVQIDERYGYIDHRGQWKISPQFKDAEEFVSGRARVIRPQRDDFVVEKVFIDKQGQPIVTSDSFLAERYAEGLAAIGIKEGNNQTKYGFVDLKGTIVIKPQFEFADQFSEGYAGIVQNNKMGFVDRNGRIAIEPQFEDATSFSEGLAAIQVNGKYGYIDKFGKIVIAPQFKTAGIYKNGLAPISSFEGKFGYIDRTGKPMISPNFKSASSFDGGLALVQTADEIAYINPTGKIVIRWTECQAYDCKTDPNNPRLNNDYEPQLIPVEVSSTPVKARIYFVPIYKWNKSPDPLNDRQLLSRFEYAGDVTNTTVRIDEQVFMVVFELNGRRIPKRLDVISSRENRVQAIF